MFNLAIDSKLRGSDMVGMKLADVAPSATRLQGRLCSREKPGIQSRSN